MVIVLVVIVVILIILIMGVNHAGRFPRIWSKGTLVQIAP